MSKLAKITALSTLLFCAGCEGISRAETIAAVQECENGGLRAVILINGFSNKVSHVRCEQLKPKGTVQ